MATSVELVEVVASALGWEQTEVFHHARNLRESSIVTKGGRGITAPQMNLMDGANLICATLGARRVKESADVAKSLARLKGVRQALRFPKNGGSRSYPLMDRGGLLDLMPGHNVQEGIAALLSLFIREDDLKKMLAEYGPPIDVQLKAEFNVFFPRYYASISVWIEGVVSESWTYSPSLGKRKGVSHREGPSWRSGGCNERALRKIANSFEGFGAER